MNRSALYILLIGSLPMISFAQSDPNAVSSPFIVVNPTSAVGVGLDYNGDSQVDAYTTVKGSDLMSVASDRRARAAELVPSRVSESAPLASVSGRIKDLKQVRLTGLRQRHVIAEIETGPHQSVAVDLGPKDQINPLNVDKGETIMVHGVQGSINRDKMLMATQIDYKGEQVQIQRPLGSDELRFAGKIQKMAVRDLGSGRTDDVLALVKLPDNEKVMVDFGSDQLLKQQDINLSRHDRVVFLAVPGSVQGADLLQATRLNADGHTVIIDQNAPLYGMAD